MTLILLILVLSFDPRLPGGYRCIGRGGAAAGAVARGPMVPLGFSWGFTAWALGVGIFGTRSGCPARSLRTLGTLALALHIQHRKSRGSAISSFRAPFFREVSSFTYLCSTGGFERKRSRSREPSPKTWQSNALRARLRASASPPPLSAAPGGEGATET